MIEAAERIVAEQGIGAMSLRAVQAAAGQRNKSAAQYHFGSRDGLVEAVVALRMAPINVRRRELLEALGDTPTLHDLVDALVRPSAEAVLETEGSHWARFVLAGFTDPTVAGVVRRSIEGEAYRDVLGRLTDALDHLPEPLRRGRVDQALGLAFVTLAAAEAQRRRPEPGPAVADLVNVCTAVLAAPAR